MEGLTGRVSFSIDLCNSARRDCLCETAYRYIGKKTGSDPKCCAGVARLQKASIAFNRESCCIVLHCIAYCGRHPLSKQRYEDPASLARRCGDIRLRRSGQNDLLVVDMIFRGSMV
jgi:hypothetical protein